MRCYYLSDLHLETQDLHVPLPSGDVLIVAGDLCHATRLDPQRTDKYSVDQRSRVMRFVDAAQQNFAHTLFVPGNHDHYDGVFDATVNVLKRYLPGVAVLELRSDRDRRGLFFWHDTLDGLREP